MNGLQQKKMQIINAWELYIHGEKYLDFINSVNRFLALAYEINPDIAKGHINKIISELEKEYGITDEYYK